MPRYRDTVRYWLGLGANLGDRAATMRRAADSLARYGVVKGRSMLYSSEPVGGPPQPPFLNAAVMLESEADPTTMLANAQTLEHELGRDRTSQVRWGPRAIDIDLLLAGDEGQLELRLPGLELPHPRLHERAFALSGVVELSPSLIHPSLHRPLSSLYAARLRHEAVASTGERL